jgi:beta-glucosidase
LRDAQREAAEIEKHGTENWRKLQSGGVMNRKLNWRASIGTRAASLVFALLLIAAAARSRAAAPSDSTASASAEKRVENILDRMSLGEKIDFIGGVDGFFVRGMPSLGLPPLKMADGPMGVRNFGPATAMAGGINLAATWDVNLALKVGEQIGRDARAKGVNFLLGPGVNIYRAPMNGRNFEYFGEDPYLAARIAVGYIDGVQSEGVSATIKHFMGDNSEYDRHNTDDIIDERTMREIYLPVFEAAVKEAHVGAVMDSYNLVDGSHMTQNSRLDSEILKKEWGFPGVLMSDWFATYDGVAAANAGLDLEMPVGAFMNKATLVSAVQDGRVPVAAIDDKVRRILRLAIRFGWPDRDQTDLSIPRYNLQGREVALQAAREGMVLLKNDGHILPLNKHTIRSIAVIGPDAYPAVPIGGGSAGVRPFAAVSFLEGVANELGASIPTYYDRGIPELNELAEHTAFSTTESGSEPGLAAEYFINVNPQGDPMMRRTDQHIDFGAVAGADLGYTSPVYPADSGSARWTGYYLASKSAAYDVFVQSTGEAGGYYRVYVDDKVILDDWTEARALVGYATVSLDAGRHKVVVERHGRPGFLGGGFRFGIVSQDSYVSASAEKIAASADAVVLAVGFDPSSESEGADRTFSLPPGQDELIEKLSAINTRVIVVVTSGGGLDMSRWFDRVPAILEAWYSGQEGGTALAQILFGDVSPSGRLPITFDRRWEDNPVHDSYYPEAGTNRVVYKEGVFVGYRGYERSGIQPLFPFGYGLSYTTFRYANLAIRRINGGTALAESGSDRASDPQYEVSWDVTNTGSCEAADVSEVYVGEDHPVVPRPARELKGFARVDLRPGQTRRAKVTLDSRAFSYYAAAAHEWQVDPGTYTVSIGSSVDQIAIKSSLSLTTSEATAATHSPFLASAPSGEPSQTAP